MQALTLLLGTNLSDRHANLDEALCRLDSVFGVQRKLAVSKVIETKACGFEGPDFLNMAVVYMSARKPETILRIIKSIEYAMGRRDAPEYTADGRRVYHDRIIDIDILSYGDLQIDSPELKIPHPQVRTRPFVGELLKEVI